MSKNSNEKYNCFIANSTDIQRKWFPSPIKNFTIDKIYESFIYEPESGTILGTAQCKIYPKYSKDAKHILNYYIGKLMIDVMNDTNKSFLQKLFLWPFYEKIKCKLLDSVNYTDTKFSSLVSIISFEPYSVPVHWNFSDLCKGTHYRISVLQPNKTNV